MPQLILNPWFFVFLFTWFSFLTLTPKKVLSYSFTNNFNYSPTLYRTSSPTWPWPWQ